MSNIILPDQNDPMVQQAIQADKQQMKTVAMAKQIELSVFISTYTQLILEHAASGELLSLDVGRGIAEAAETLSGQYVGFLLERVGLVTLEKKEPMTQAQVDQMLKEN